MNIIITGASKGIGRALTLQMASDTNNQIIAIARNQKQLFELQQACQHRNVHALSFDLARLHNQSDKLFELINSRFEHVDILINNAGSLLNKPFTDSSSDEVLELFKTNYLAPSELIRILLPLLGGNEPSHVVNIGSMGGFQGSGKFAGLSHYSASKGALAILTEVLALELKKQRIFCNCLALGAVQTDMLALAFSGYNAPLKPEQMAEFIANFAFSGHHFFNGKVLPVSLSTP